MQIAVCILTHFAVPNACLNWDHLIEGIREGHNMNKEVQEAGVKA